MSMIKDETMRSQGEMNLETAGGITKAQDQRAAVRLVLALKGQEWRTEYTH